MNIEKRIANTLGTPDTPDIKADLPQLQFHCSECGVDLANRAYTFFEGELVCFTCFWKLRKRLEAEKTE